MVRRVIVIGANAAGVEAASAARKKDRTAEITLITQEKNAGYSRCGLPFVIGGHIPKFTDLIVYPPAYFQMLKLTLKNETKVTAINTKEKTVTYVTKGRRHRNNALRQPRNRHRRRRFHATNQGTREDKASSAYAE